MEEKWETTRIIEEMKERNLSLNIQQTFCNKKGVRVCLCARLHICNVTERRRLPDSTRYIYCLTKAKPDVTRAFYLCALDLTLRARPSLSAKRLTASV